MLYSDKLRVCCLTFSLLAAGITEAASIYAETFATGLAGWTNNIDAAKWIAVNQSARVSFNAGVLPQNASLEAGPAASAGMFSGSYVEAGIEVIGFSFLAENVQPSVLKLEIRGGTNVVFQDLRPRLTTAGSWNYLLCPLTGRDAGQWSGAPSTEFANILTNISRVAIRVTTGGNSDQAFRLDDIFLDRLPTANHLAAVGANSTEVLWSNLRTNFSYRMEFTGAITGEWTGVASIISTGTTARIAHTNGTPDGSAFYRLSVP
jgi:hypothetical protein